MSSFGHPSTLDPQKSALCSTIQANCGTILRVFSGILSETSQNNLLISLRVSGRRNHRKKNRIYCSIIVSSIVIVHNREHNEFSILKVKVFISGYRKIWDIVKNFHWKINTEIIVIAVVWGEKWNSEHHKLSPSKSVCLTNIFSQNQNTVEAVKGERIFEKFEISNSEITSNWCGKKVITRDYLSIVIWGSAAYYSENST